MLHPKLETELYELKSLLTGATVLFESRQSEDGENLVYTALAKVRDMILENTALERMRLEETE